MLFIFFYVFMVLLFRARAGKTGIFANMFLLMTVLGLLFFIDKIGTIIWIVIIAIIIWLLSYSGSNKSKERDEIKFSNNSIKFKEDLY